MIDRTKAPALKEYSDVRLSMPEWQTLPNGLQWCVVDYGEVEVCQIDVFVGGGILEQPKRYIAQLLTSMLAKGSGKYTSEDVAEQMDFYGAITNGSVSDHYIKRSMRCTNEKLEKLLPIFFDMITSPSFPQKELDKLSDRIVADATVRLQRVSAIAGVRMSQMYYGLDSPLAGEMSADGVRKVSVDDLREFYSRHFAPGNCKVVISGAVSDDVTQQITKWLGAWQPRQYDALTPWRRTPESKKYDEILKPDASQTAVSITIDAIGREHPDYIPLRILIMVFGGYFGSRLMSNIREDKGYTYDIQSYLVGRKEDGYIGIGTECASQYTNEVLVEIKREMKRLRDELIGHYELEIVKNHMLTDLVKTLDNAFSIAGYIESMICYGVSPDYFNNQFVQVQNITSEQLQKMAQKYLVEDSMRIVLVGDTKKFGHDAM